MNRVALEFMANLVCVSAPPLHHSQGFGRQTLFLRRRTLRADGVVRALQHAMHADSAWGYWLNSFVIENVPLLSVVGHSGVMIVSWCCTGAFGRWPRFSVWFCGTAALVRVSGRLERVCLFTFEPSRDVSETFRTSRRSC